MKIEKIKVSGSNIILPSDKSNKYALFISMNGRSAMFNTLGYKTTSVEKSCRYIIVWSEAIANRIISKVDQTKDAHCRRWLYSNLAEIKDGKFLMPDSAKSYFRAGKFVLVTCNLNGDIVKEIWDEDILKAILQENKVVVKGFNDIKPSIAKKTTNPELIKKASQIVVTQKAPKTESVKKAPTTDLIKKATNANEVKKRVTKAHSN